MTKESQNTNPDNLKHQGERGRDIHVSQQQGLNNMSKETTG